MNLAIFDIDGTLLDNLASEDACYAAALREGLGLSDLNTDWRQYEHVTDEGVAVEAHRRAFGTAPTPTRVKKTVDRFLALLVVAHADQPLTPIRGAAALLAALPACGWMPALATGAWGRAARFKLTAAGLPLDGLPLATAEDGPARPTIVRAAWARAVAARKDSTSRSAPFERVVLVGDGIWDVAAAQSLGLPFVGRAAGSQADELRKSGAEIIVEDFTRLDSILTAFEAAVVPRRAAP